MSQRAMKPAQSGRPDLQPVRSEGQIPAGEPTLRERLTRVLIVAVTGIVIVALAYDMVSGRWIGGAGVHVAAGLAAVLLLLPAARKVRHLHLALIYIFGLFVYTVLRSFAHRTGIPIRTEYVIRLDRTLFFGYEPTRWLQDHLFDPGELHFIDFLTVQVHWSFFVLPHLAGLMTYVWRREWFPKYVAIVLGTFYAGLVLYFLVPTAPPWLAADDGMLPGVWRVMDFVGGQVDRDNYQRLYDALGVPNPVAAMPSLHMGVTFAVFLFARRVNRWLGRTMLAYAVLMGFSLVYMGEHYVADVIAGVLLATIVYRVVLRVGGPLPEPERARF